MKMILTIARITMASCRMEFLKNSTSPLMIINAALVPVVFVTLCIIIRTPDSRMEPLVWGAILTGLWGSTVWAAGGVLRRERNSGTLAKLAMSPQQGFWVLYGKTLGASTLATGLTFTAGIVACRLLHNTTVALGSLTGLVIASVLLIFSSTGLGSALACLFLVSRHGIAWSSLLMYPVFTVGGLLVPPDAIPAYASWIPNTLSLHWIHGFLVDNSSGTFNLWSCAIALGLSILYSAAGYCCYTVTMSVAKKKGTLNFV